MAAVIFPDGTRLTATTWRELEDHLRADRWNPASRKKFRKEFRVRARNWSGTEIELETSSRNFFGDLERAGLLLIEGTWNE